MTVLTLDKNVSTSFFCVRIIEPLIYSFYLFIDHCSMETRQAFWDSNPKVTFLMGIFLGFAVSSLIALAVILTLVMSGSKNAAAVATTTPPVVDDGGDKTPPTPAAKPVKNVDAKVDHILGPANAKVTLIEYSDFECPYCGRHAPTVSQLMKEFPKDVRLVFRHYPLSFHANAQKAGEASECVAKLGGNNAFWKMHDKLFANNTKLSEEAYVTWAKESGVKEAAFKTCLSSGEMAGRVASDLASGNDAGVEGTPATFVNGTLVSGAVPYEMLKAAAVSAGAKN